MLYKFALVPILQTMLWVYAVHCEEPSCTKFTFLEQLLEKIVRMEMKMEAYKEQLDDVRQPQEKPGQSTSVPVAQPLRSSVAFFASLSGRSTFHKDAIVKFDNVITNIGNGYDSSTGTFRAPVDGTYFFQATILTDNGIEVWAYFTLNGNVMSKLNCRGTDRRHGSGSQSLLVTLHQNDEVQLINTHNSKYYGDGYSTLTGYLLN